MKLQAISDDGVVRDIDDAMQITAAERQQIANALHDAQALISQDHHVIASIKSDIQSVVWRIETELGAHPAFTWAQTKLANAAAHLDAYVKGSWTEPVPAPDGVVVDQRGAIVAVPAAEPPTIAAAAAAQAATPAA